MVKRKRPRSIPLGGVVFIQQAIWLRGVLSFNPSRLLRRETFVLQFACLDDPLIVPVKREQDQAIQDDHACESASPLPPLVTSAELQQSLLLAQFRENMCWIENRLASRRYGYTWNETKQVVRAIHASVGKNLGDITSLLCLTDMIKVLLETCDSRRSDGGTYSEYCAKEIVLGCIWHFTESMEARRCGLLDSDFVVNNVLLRHDHDQTHGHLTNSRRKLVLPVGRESVAIQVEKQNSQMISVVRTTSGDSMDSAAMLTLDPSAASNEKGCYDGWTIARCAARMKRIEVLSRAIGAAALSTRDADHIRCLLLTVEDFDWRALLIRCVSNYNEIKAIHQRSARAVRAAREGLLVYGPLAAMLGLAELKAKIEDHAFRFLYPRQHKAVDSIFRSANNSIECASSFLSSHIQAILLSDEFLQEQVEDLLVSSRVKGRYSFWKKFIRKKAEFLEQSSIQKVRSNRTRNQQWNKTLIDQVPDTVALRVVLRSRKYGIEPAEVTQAKEKLLCYYVQEKIRGKWPVWDPLRTKDYIQSPKPNSYQSLHYTSSIVIGNDDLPFEVQVRSHDMHLAAEYGSASHSIYKMQVKGNATSGLLIPTTPQPSALAMPYSYLESLRETRSAVVGQNTFVFVSVPQKKSNIIISIPRDGRDCCVQDAIAHLPVALSKSSIFVNGKTCQLHETIKNGDAILVLESNTF